MAFGDAKAKCPEQGDGGRLAKVDTEDKLTFLQQARQDQKTRFTFLAMSCWDICHEEITLDYLAGCSTWSDKSVKQKKRSWAAGNTYFKSSFETEETEEQVVSVWIDQHQDGEFNHN